MTVHTHTPAPAEAVPDGPITSIAIREFVQGNKTPIRTIHIPVKVFTLASALVPRRVRDELAKEGFDLEGILQAAREIRSPVTLVEVEEHQKGRKIVVSLE